MNIPEFLDLAVELELGISALYSDLAHISNDPPVSGRMAILANEEIKHANILRSGKQYYETMPDLFAGVSLDVSDLIRGEKEIKAYLESIGKSAVPFISHLRNLLEFERRFEKIHLASAVQINDPALKALFVNLSKGDSTHISILRVLIDSYGIES